jgi:RNase P subunit RPR2
MKKIKLLGEKMKNTISTISGSIICNCGYNIKVEFDKDERRIINSVIKCPKCNNVYRIKIEKDENMMYR